MNQYNTKPFEKSELPPLSEYECVSDSDHDNEESHRAQYQELNIIDDFAKNNIIESPINFMNQNPVDDYHSTDIKNKNQNSDTDFDWKAYVQMPNDSPVAIEICSPDNAKPQRKLSKISER